jgi:hypothetical protein
MKGTLIALVMQTSLMLQKVWWGDSLKYARHSLTHVVHSVWDDE